MSLTRVLIIDDSPTMCACIREVLKADPNIAVVGQAGNPHAARQAIKQLSPDAITLDINMPGMSGLEFLEKLMRLRPLPVVVVSGEGGGAKVQSEALGAVGFFAKPLNGDIHGAFAGLASCLRRAVAGNGASASSEPRFEPNGRFVVIGASTGGVDALAVVLEQFPANCPPTLITQHMPAGFTGSFAQRLNQSCRPTVLEAESGVPLEVGKVFIAPGGDTHLEVVDGTSRPICRLIGTEPCSGHRPSVDVLFKSAAKFGAKTVGVILTGMGGDGAYGLAQIRKAGGSTIGQDQKTSLVYGMPRVAKEYGGVEIQHPLPRIGMEILARCNKNAELAK